MAKKANGNGTDTAAAPKLSASKKQLEIKGAERPADPELDELIAPFVEARYERQRLQGQEIELHAQLLEALKAKKRKTYRYVDGDTVYDLELGDATQKVKVKRTSEASQS
jgi:hypothetical protein